MRHLYTLLLGLFIPFIILRTVWRSRSNPAFLQRMGERFGSLPNPDKPVRVWVHAVSVGETIAAKPLIEQLISVYGDKAVLVTSTTLTGSDTVRRLFNKQVLHHYFPYDLPFIVNRYVNKIKPDIFVCMETEIWPNLWRCCYQQEIPVVLANARLSDRSTQRYLMVKRFVTRVLNNAWLIACRGDDDAENFMSLGVDAHKVHVMGDLKFDIQVSLNDKKKGEGYKQQWGASRRVLVAASTHQGEDDLVLSLFKSLKKTMKDLLLVIVPRHPERFDDVAKQVEQRGFRIQRRSHRQQFSKEVEVVLGDSMGEMMSWYVAADVVFMGGSLVPTGGHNPLEALACGVPVITGLHIFNFKRLFEELEQKGAAFKARNTTELTDIAQHLLTDKQAGKEAGLAGLALLEKDKGATQKLLRVITSLSNDNFTAS